MKAKRSVTILAIAVCGFGLLPSLADDTPRAYHEGFRCHVVDADQIHPGETSGTIFVCQIVDAPDPMGTGSLRPAGAGGTAPPLDSPLQLLTTLDHALGLQLAQSPRHGRLDTPKPTP